MNAVIFDTETNGKILDWNQPLRNDESISNFPRITQLAWQKVELETGKVLNEYQSLISPAGWTIPTVEQQKKRGEKNPSFFIDNNMSTERCKEFGKPLREVLPLIISDLQDSEIVVAHNIKFDMPVIGAEFLRLNFNVGKQLIKVCTMESTTDLLKLPGYNGKHKFPKLVELYKYLFGKEMAGNHDAFADVIGCRDCFLELIKLNHLKF